MTRSSNLSKRQSAVSGLPVSARTRSGVLFRPGADIWKFRDGVTGVNLNFEQANQYMTDELVYGLKQTLIWLLQNKASGTAVSVYSTFLHFIRSIECSTESPLAEIKSSDLINYRARLSKRQVNRLRTLATLLRKWWELDLLGVNEEAIKLLGDLRLKASPTGESVRTMCPFSGPLSQLEDESFQYSLNAAFAKGQLKEDEFFSIWITRALGQRPCQSAAMKVCDLFAETHADQSVEYTIQVPRAKQRDRIHPRASFKVRPLIPQIGEPLFDYVRRVAERFTGTLNDVQMAPMFPRENPDGSAGYEYHRTGNEMSRLITGAIAKIDAFSERTGKKLHVFPTRLRRTVGTRAAQEGHSELVIAEVLDHSNIASAAYYVEAVPEIAIRIDQAMAKTLAPIAKAFQGIVPDRVEAKSIVGESKIIDLRIDRSGKSMGACGSNRSCSFNAPIACYTCRSFRPWLDGPHQAVLDHMLNRREHQLAQSDARIASVNDRTILAIAEVIAMCSDRLDGRSL